MRREPVESESWRSRGEGAIENCKLGRKTVSRDFLLKNGEIVFKIKTEFREYDIVIF